MEPSERDTTQDWLLPEAAAPPLLGELEERIEEAVASAHAAEDSARAAEESARAAEEGVRAAEERIEAIGATALEAARRAGQAAEAAERASGVALDASRARLEGPPEDLALRSFSERADRVVARLRALERVPRRPGAPSAVVGRRRGGG